MGGEWPEQPSPRFLLHRLMRRDDLCPKPENCADVPWGEAHLGPCHVCPLERLNRALDSERGRVIGGVVDIDFALQAGFQINLGQVNYYEFCLLRILGEERKRHEAEQIERSRHGR